jgi:hypothetical protein
MKKLLSISLIMMCLAFVSCNDSATKQKELELKEKELELKEKELSMKDGGNTNNTTTNTPAPSNNGNNTSNNATKGSTSTPPSASTKTIVGTGVLMRAQPSVEGAKVSSFNNNESVEVLETKAPQNQNEAVTATEVKLYSDYNGKYITTLNKGKALVIDRKEGNTYYVTYQHPQYGKLYATLPSSSLESIANLSWYKVKRSTGQTGWVLGKFVQ